MTEDLNSSVSLKVYKLYISLASTPKKSVDYVSANFDGIALRKIQICESLSIKKTPFINYGRNTIEDRVVKFL